MNILILITGLGMGGAENVVVRLADRLVAKGHRVKILYMTGQAAVKPDNPDISIVSLDIKSLLTLPQAYLRARNIVKKFKPDIVHSHMFHANIFARVLRMTVSIPKLICTSHSNNEGGGIRMLIYRLTDSLSDISTNVSQDAVNSLIQKGALLREKTLCIPNGIDIKKFRFDLVSRKRLRQVLNVNHKHLILAVGRMHPAKDYSNLLHAIALMKKERSDFILYIVGDGPLKNDLLHLTKSLDIQHHVKFLGLRTDIPELLSACDTFVLSSGWEGFGLVVAEAMACERIVVATDCGGVREIIENSGYLVPPRDSYKLYKALSESLDLSEKERYSLGQKARQRIIDNYSLDKNVNSYLDAYNS